MGMTMAEKILAAHSARKEVKPGEYVWADVDSTMTASRGLEDNREMLEDYGLNFDPDRIYIVSDHRTPPPTRTDANSMVEMRKLVKKYGIKHFFDIGRHGIMHEIFPQYGYVSPGDLVVGVDSHSTSQGCFNAAACSVSGDTDLIMTLGKLWFRVPPSIKFVLDGTWPGPERFVVGKDVFLRIASEYGTDVGLYRSVEFEGPVVHQMSMASRFTVSNQGVDIGAKFAIFPCDEKTLEYLEGKMKRPAHPISSDSDAVYESIYNLDMTDMPPYVACPHDPSNSVSVTEVEPKRIKIDQGFIGSCASGRLEDFRMAAKILKGHKVHPDVRLILSPASQMIWNDCLKEGLWNTISEAEALVCHSTCGPCGGSQLGLIGEDEACITTSTRNFQGRMGPPSSSVYMGNAATVAASCVTGYITDPRKFL
ncbi:aconitase/3-isopropylmalate dehydratase large subunit family protein [Chloroflexota bacterium]